MQTFSSLEQVVLDLPFQGPVCQSDVVVFVTRIHNWPGLASVRTTKQYPVSVH